MSEYDEKKTKTFIIAEAGVNHNGRLDLAKELIDIAVASGADAVKFQTFVVEESLSSVHFSEEYLEWAKSIELSFSQFKTLSDYCKQKGIMFLSSPFDIKSVNFLDSIDMPLFKVASGEIINFPLLESIAKTGKPMILSTGMASTQDISLAVQKVRSFQKDIGNDSFFQSCVDPFVLLHCISEYPTPYHNVNLSAMQWLHEEFKLPVGLSDHSLGIEVPIAAVAMGACVIEKHFTIDKNLKGPDHELSLDPGELKKMIESIRNVEKALGDGKNIVLPVEKELQKSARKSLVAALDIKKGTKIEKDMIVAKRPGRGIPPKDMKELIGKYLVRDIKKDQMFDMDFLVVNNE